MKSNFGKLYKMVTVPCGNEYPDNKCSTGSCLGETARGVFVLGQKLFIATRCVKVMKRKRIISRIKRKLEAAGEENVVSFRGHPQCGLGYFLGLFKSIPF